MPLKTKNSPSKIAVDAHKFLIAEFAELADADKAVEMAAYMKTDMPFWGIQSLTENPFTGNWPRNMHRPITTSMRK